MNIKVNIPERFSFEKANLEAIVRLVTILETTPDEKFNIGSWSCGTVYCAVGLAGCDPWFNSKGLHLDKDGDIAFNPENWKGYYPAQQVHWGAIVEMFGISYEEAEWLFSGMEYISEYPEPKFTVEQQAVINTESNDSQNILFQHIPKSAVITRLKQVLELRQYDPIKGFEVPT